MSETVTDTRKQCRCPKALAVLAILAGGALLCIALAALMRDNTAAWREALPKPGMSRAEAEGAALRAKYLHEAFIRPQLITAGFSEPQDARNVAAQGRQPLSGILTDALWTMRLFPETHTAFLDMLCDRKLSREEKLRRFFRFGSLLDTAATLIATGKNIQPKGNMPAAHASARAPQKAPDWFAGYNAPGQNTGQNTGRNTGQALDTVTGQVTDPGAKSPKAVYAAALNTARQALPLMLADLGRETNALETAKSPKKQIGTRGSDIRLASLSWAMLRSASAMGEKRDDPGFMPLVRDLLASDKGTVRDRYAAVPLMARKPGLPVTEYIAWDAHKGALDALSRRLAANPGYYAYPLGMGKLTKTAGDTLKAQGAVTIGNDSGPGVSVTYAEAFMPEQDPAGKLYLLADMPSALAKAPKYDLSRAWPVFTGTLLRRLENQPLVLPLNPGREADKAVMAWYAEQGWKEGRTVLFSAVGSPVDVARHWGSTCLVWWSDRNERAARGQYPAILHPESGEFMAAVLPRLRGESAARFLGPVTALWFGRVSEGPSGWLEERYVAKPEVQPSVTALAARTQPMKSPFLDNMIVDTAPHGEKQAAPPAPSPKTEALVFSPALRDAMAAGFKQQRRITLARNLSGEQAGETMSPAAACEFVDNALTSLAGWGIKGAGAEEALGYLWRFRNDTEKERQLTTILSDTRTRPGERLRDVRRAFAPAAEKGAML